MSPNLQTPVTSFLHHLGNERRLSPLTLQHYQRDLVAMMHYCASHRITQWQALKPKALRHFVATLHHQGLSGKSIQRTLSALRSFYRYLQREHAVTNNPVMGISAPKSARRLPKTLTADQAARLVSVDQTEPLDLRDRAMLELLYSSGLRLAELVALNLNDLDLQEGIARVLGKGGKTRLVPVGAKACAALRQWLSARNLLSAAGETAVFITRQGKRLGARAVQLRLKHWSLQQGLPVSVHPVHH